MVIDQEKEIIYIIHNLAHIKTQKLHTVIKATNISIGYSIKKERTIVAEKINFELTKGKLVGLVGANGIGKSTLLRTLTKNQTALAGDIEINGQSISKISPLHLATQLSVVLTETIADTNLTVLEIVNLGRQPYTNWIGRLTKKDQEKITFALQAVNIENLAAKKCFELSDGQIQKVMLARALAQDTDIIVLDEPTTHLDLYHKVYILKLLQRLAKETHKTILFSTHEINVALSLCDELIVMKNKQTHFGSPKELINQNAFDSLFPDDLVEFNSTTNSFSIK